MLPPLPLLLFPLLLLTHLSLAKTLFLAGDSTTAPDTGTPFQGWGEQIGAFLSIPVVNDAIPGLSSRSFTDQGDFEKMFGQVQEGDIVVIEFGHNEGGGPINNPNQGVCPGTDVTTTCNVNGTIVFTFFKYMIDAITSFKSLNTSIIVSSQTPDNPFTTNPSSATNPPEFVSFAQQVASQTSVHFVDHFATSILAYEELGEEVVNGFFTEDQDVHTDVDGAKVLAQSFVRGLLCDDDKEEEEGGINPLVEFVTNRSVIPASCP